MKSTPELETEIRLRFSRISESASLSIFHNFGLQDGAGGVAKTAVDDKPDGGTT